MGEGAPRQPAHWGHRPGEAGLTVLDSVDAVFCLVIFYKDHLVEFTKCKTCHQLVTWTH